MGERGVGPWLIERPDELTAGWVTAVLRHSGAIGESCSVSSFACEEIGTGQVGSTVRVRLAYTGRVGPASVVCKFASADPQSAQAGVWTKTYETEVSFYRELADHTSVRRPVCHYAEVEPGTARVVVVLEDLAPAEQGDQIAGCSVAQAELVIDEAVRLHGPAWGDTELMSASWLDPSAISEVLVAILPGLWQAFIDRYADRLSALVRTQGERLVAGFGAIVDDPSTQTLVHRDFRLDNIMFPPDGGRAVIVDWQLIRRGLGPADVAYFLGSAFEPELRRANERALLARYHDGLVGCGVAGYSLDACWHDYCRSAGAALLMAAISSVSVGRTDRGDDMFMAMAERSAQMMADLWPATDGAI